MATRWVALLRGIAPMNTNQKNEQLRGVCESLGFERVASVQSSGNLIFDADSDDRSEVAGLLETAWPERLGFEARSILRTPDELDALVRLEPFGDGQHGPGSYQLATFFVGPVEVAGPLPHRPDGAAFELVAATRTEVFTVTDTTGSAGSPDTMTWLERTYGKDLTSRTWPTVHRILKRC